LAPTFESSPLQSARPNSRVVAALCGCIGLQYIIYGGYHLNLINVPSATALFFLHLMGPPDPPSDFLPTHLVLRVPPRLFSSAHVGFIHDNGTHFMSQYLTPLASSQPNPTPGPLVHLGGIPHGQRSVPSTGCSLHASSIYGLVGTSSVPVGSALCTRPSRHYFHGASSPRSRRGYFWVAPTTWGSMGDLAPSFH
jgi:hypothetical protein